MHWNEGSGQFCSFGGLACIWDMHYCLTVCITGFAGVIIRGFGSVCYGHCSGMVKRRRNSGLLILSSLYQSARVYLIELAGLEPTSGTRYRSPSEIRILSDSRPFRCYCILRRERDHLCHPAN
jgi:hypothetical protein